MFPREKELSELVVRLPDTSGRCRAVNARVVFDRGALAGDFVAGQFYGGE